ncbi:(2Fe-2S)-binding protein [Perlabentimonas gracilis]|jgi:nitrite reductase (NADH) large subunit|uniref:(2Fe-2S)-binding protein n=1 Tax=Perlabentimonas gracilis TaxID=2715279 RepID=UPI00140C2E6F|nr:(2Fe-2S)-binding protein [Perlabentimonas gracilis]NHB68760.1 (2Fe-2S)-binding protein [Perlabentimonas gracilis]
MHKVSKFICQCKSVTPAEIKSSVRRSGARSILDVQNLTRATTGCGRCKPLVMELIEVELEKINSKGMQLRIDF